MSILTPVPTKNSPRRDSPEEPAGPGDDAARLVALAQAAEFVITGIWPFVSMRTFQAVTGPKIDGWLVKTVGALVTVSGSAIGMAAARRRITPEIILLAVGSSAALAAIEVWFVLRRRISKAYLADALVQGVFIAGWLASLRRQSPRDQR